MSITPILAGRDYGALRLFEDDLDASHYIPQRGAESTWWWLDSKFFLLRFFPAISADIARRQGARDIEVVPPPIRVTFTIDMLRVGIAVDVSPACLAACEDELQRIDRQIGVVAQPCTEGLLASRLCFESSPGTTP